MSKTSSKKTLVWRKCMGCGQIFEKAHQFTMDEFQCTTCYIKRPERSEGLRQSGTGVPVRGFRSWEDYKKTDVGINQEEAEAYQKLFKYIDEDGSGVVDASEITEKLEKMLGDINWTECDDNMDGQMEMNEFVQFMGKLNANLRYSAVLWSRQCLDSLGRRPSWNKPKAVEKKQERTEEDVEFEKLFHHLDSDNSGELSTSEIEEHMRKMFGDDFVWTDADADGSMDKAEFVDTMKGLAANLRYSAVMWSKQCLTDDGKRRGSFRKADKASGAAKSKTGTSDEDVQFTKLFKYLDGDGSGELSNDEIENQMRMMLGDAWSWKDADADGMMDGKEFVATMKTMPANTKAAAMSWARACLDANGRKIK